MTKLKLFIYSLDIFIYNVVMDLKHLLLKLHKTIESKEVDDISQAKMAQKIGVSNSTYKEYRRGVNQPLAMKALLEMLNLVDDEDIVKVVRMWKQKYK